MDKKARIHEIHFTVEEIYIIIAYHLIMFSYWNLLINIVKLKEVNLVCISR